MTHSEITSTLAITGHRPKDLGPPFEQVHIFNTISRISEHLFKQEKDLVGLHIGGALGIDTYTAMTFGATMLTMHVHLPFTPTVMQRFWSRDQRDNWAEWHARGQFCETCPAPAYAPQYYQRRNEHMVDSADILLAFWNGKQHGGTWNCIQYALKGVKPVLNGYDGVIRNLRKL